VFNISAKPDGSIVSSTHDGARLGVLPDGRVLAVEETTNSDLLWRLFRAGDPYSQPAWQPFPEARIGDGNEPRVATGPRGTFVLSERTPADELLDNKAGLRVRALRRGRLTAGRTLAGDAVIQGTNTSDDLAQDARGRLHAAWTSTSGHNHCVVYARTKVRRRSWFGPSTTLFKSHSFATSPVSVHVAAAPDGRGVAVWQDEGASSDQVLHIRAATLRQRRGKARLIRNPFHRPACPRG
jgi:hypothetical protein